MLLIKRNLQFMPINKTVFMRSFFTVLIFTSLFISELAMAQESKIVDQVVAIVGKETVLLSDIENQVIQLRAQGYYTSGDLKCEVFEELLNAKLMVNQAKLDSVEVNDTEINGEMERRLNMFINQIGSEEKLEEYYGKSIPEIKVEFREVIREQLLSQRLQGEVTSDLKVTPNEIRTFYNGLHKDSLPLVNTEFELEQIVINPKIKETEILRIKDKLREFKERVNKGESFATLAVLYSEDKGSAVKGGELGFVSRGDLVPEFSAVAFNLDVNQVSKIVKTDYGYHIIQLIQKKGERINCRHILLKPRVSIQEKRNTSLKLDTIKLEIDKGTLTFKQACWKYSDSEDTRLNGGIMVNPMTGKTKWEASQIQPKIAYAIRDLKVGEISEPFESEDENGNPIYQIILLKSKSEPHKANMKDDYQLLQDMTLNKMQEEFMKDWIMNKVKNTYIHINDDYKNCKFNNDIWKVE